MTYDVVESQCTGKSCLGHVFVNGQIALHALVQRAVARHTVIGAHQIAVGCLCGVVGIVLHVAVVARLVVCHIALSIKGGEVGVAKDDIARGQPGETVGVKDRDTVGVTQHTGTVEHAHGLTFECH